MRKLLDGIQRFQDEAFDSRTELFRELLQWQSPAALFITCSDSRIDPNLMMQADPGDFFVLRNAGNIIPPYGAACGGEAATIEYAVSVLGVRDVIVCRHSHCGAMAGLLDHESVAALPAVKTWLKHAEATSRVVTESRRDVSDPAARLTAAVEANVLVQLANLRTYPSVAAALPRQELQLHGWVYRFETGEVFAYSTKSARFQAVASADD